MHVYSRFLAAAAMAAVVVVGAGSADAHLSSF